MKFRTRFSLMSLAIMSVLSTSSVIPAYADSSKSRVCKNGLETVTKAKVSCKDLLSGFVDSREFEIELKKWDKSKIKIIESYEKNQLKEFTSAFSKLSKVGLNCSPENAQKLIEKIQRLQLSFGNYLYTIYKRHFIYNFYNKLSSNEYSMFFNLKRLSYDENTNMVENDQVLHAILDVKKHKLFDSNFKSALRWCFMVKAGLASKLNNSFHYVSPDKVDKNGNKIENSSGTKAKDKKVKNKKSNLLKPFVGLLKFKN